MTRHITHRQEQIYRMRHQDFAGLTTKQVAAILGVKSRVIYHHMHEMRKIAPQLFPILSKRRVKILELWLNNFSPKEIGLYFGITTVAVYSAFYDIKNIVVLTPSRRARLVSYKEWMAPRIKQKF